MTPSSTFQTSVRPFHPERSLPLKIGWRSSFFVSAAKALKEKETSSAASAILMIPSKKN